MMPQGAGILSVQSQGDSLVVWALITKATLVDHEFEIFETGKEIPPTPEIPGLQSVAYCRSRYGRQYLGTVQMNSGSYVLHVFLRTIP